MQLVQVETSMVSRGLHLEELSLHSCQRVVVQAQFRQVGHVSEQPGW